MSKKCQDCLKKPIGRNKCLKCFKKLIDKTVDSEIKKRFKYQDTITILNNNTLSYEIIKKIVREKNHIKLKETKNSNEAIIFPKNLNDISVDFFKNIHKRKKFEYETDKVFPLENFTEKELEIYFENKENEERKKDPYENFVEKLGDKNPEFLFGIKKFLEKLK